MKTETKTVAEYKAPKCKCVEFYMNRAFMQEVSSPYGAVGAAGSYYTDGDDNVHSYDEL